MRRLLLLPSLPILLIAAGIALPGCEDDPDRAKVDGEARDLPSEAGDTNRDTNALDCSLAGCGAPPICGQSCQASCGCCSCAEGEIVTRNGRAYRCEGACYSPVDAGAPEVNGEVSAETGGETAACPTCASDEICVQLNDSANLCRSPTPTLRCRRISTACRAELPLISSTNRSCQAVSAACQQELCQASFQCSYTPPCGNESAAAQAWCYGQ